MIEGERPGVEAGLAELVGQLAGDAREVASAEIGLIKARVSTSVSRFRSAAILFAIAGVLALAALVALLFGLIVTLSPYVGPGAATAIVVGVVLVIAGVFALVARGKLASRTSKP
ncbi:MAG: phage holin family protein [Sphingomonas bacterium]